MYSRESRRTRYHIKTAEHHVASVLTFFKYSSSSSPLLKFFIRVFRMTILFTLIVSAVAILLYVFQFGELFFHPLRISSEHFGSIAIRMIKTFPTPNGILPEYFPLSTATILIRNGSSEFSFIRISRGTYFIKQRVSR